MISLPSGERPLEILTLDIYKCSGAVFIIIIIITLVVSTATGQFVSSGRWEIDIINPGDEASC